MYLGLSLTLIYQQCMLFSLGIGHILINVTREIKLVHETYLVCDHLWHTNRLLITNREPPELSLYAFKAVWRITFETPWGKPQNLFGIKLTTDVTLLFLSPMNNIYLFIFYNTGVDYAMKLSQSINSACCFELVYSNLCMK